MHGFFPRIKEENNTPTQSPLPKGKGRDGFPPQGFQEKGLTTGFLLIRPGFYYDQR